MTYEVKITGHAKSMSEDELRKLKETIGDLGLDEVQVHYSSNAAKRYQFVVRVLPEGPLP